MSITLDGTLGITTPTYGGAVTAELAKRFNKAFEYRDGELYWKIDTNKSLKKIGKKAGCKSTGCYGVVNLDKTSYSIHKVIFCMHHGYMPKVVDHINRLRDDHRIENLRAANHSTNNQNKIVQSNNKLGIKNVCWSKQNKKYYVQISQNRRRIFKKFFDDLELAELVACMAREKYHGEFANHGVRI
jgi:hypothetical protein